jgi:hypothetical protein
MGGRAAMIHAQLSTGLDVITFDPLLSSGGTLVFQAGTATKL